MGWATCRGPAAGRGGTCRTPFRRATCGAAPSWRPTIWTPRQRWGCAACVGDGCASAWRAHHLHSFRKSLLTSKGDLSPPWHAPRATNRPLCPPPTTTARPPPAPSPLPPPQIPWEDLRYMVGEIMYGGHVVEGWDRRLVGAYLDRLLAPPLLEGGAAGELCPGFGPPPPALTHAQVRGGPLVRFLPRKPPSALLDPAKTARLGSTGAPARRRRRWRPTSRRARPPMAPPRWACTPTRSWAWRSGRETPCALRCAAWRPARSGAGACPGSKTAPAPPPTPCSRRCRRRWRRARRAPRRPRATRGPL